MSLPERERRRHEMMENVKKDFLFPSESLFKVFPPLSHPPATQPSSFCFCKDENRVGKTLVARNEASAKFAKDIKDNFFNFTPQSTQPSTFNSNQREDIKFSISNLCSLTHKIIKCYELNTQKKNKKNGEKIQVFIHKSNSHFVVS